jgi:hypothetical protein
MTSATCSSECRIKLRYSVQHLEFSSESDSGRSDVHIPALKLQADVVSLLAGRM